MTEGESLRVTKSLGESIKKVVDFSETGNTDLESLRGYFSEKTSELEQAEVLGESVNTGSEWSKKREGAKEWVDEDPKRQRVAIDSAKIFKKLDQKGEKSLSETEKRSLDRLRKTREEDFEQVVVRGFELWAEESVEKSTEEAKKKGEQVSADDLGGEWDNDKFGERPYQKDASSNIKVVDDKGKPIPLSPEGENYIKDMRLIKMRLSEDTNRTTRHKLLDKMDAVFDDFNKHHKNDISAGELTTFLVEFNEQYADISRGMEQRERVGTIEAFFNFMIETDGKEWKIEGVKVRDMESEERDRIVKKLIKDPSNDHNPENQFSEEEVDRWRTSFEQWFRHWWVGELDDISSTNQNSFISGLTQIDAPLTVMGLLNNIPIISILGAMDTSEGKWGDFVGETISQLQTMSAIHNRERLYARAKNIAPEKVLEVMLGISEQVAGRGESLAVDGKSWKTLFNMKELESERETFGNTFKKALALYLSMDVDIVYGNLTREVLEDGGFEIDDIMVVDRRRVVEDGAGGVVYLDENLELDNGRRNVGEAEVVVENIFPIESQKEDDVDVQRKKMVEILFRNGASRKAALMAEKLAFNAFEVGFGGADVDADMSAKEAMYKLVHTRIYRTKYVKASKKAGSPLSLEDIDRLAMTYFDMIKLPVEEGERNQGEGVERSFRKYILDQNVVANDIPIEECINRPDYYFYDGVLQWGTKMWGYLNEGLGVPWENVLRRGDTPDKGEVIDPEYINALQDAYKYTGYWIGGLSADEIAAFIQPFDTREDSAINVYCQRYNDSIVPENSEANKEANKKTLGELKGKVTKLVFRRMVFRELQELGDKYNPAVKNMNPLKPVLGGRRLDTHDLARIHYMLVEGVSKLPLIEEDHLFGDDLEPLFDEKMVLSMLYDAGLTTWKPTLKNLGDTLAKLAELSALKRGAGH